MINGTFLTAPYSRIENGNSAISYAKVIEISKVLNVATEDIIEKGDSDNFIFNNCNQSGKIDSINNNYDFEQERKAYLEQIKYLQEQNAELLKIIQNLKPAV